MGSMELADRHCEACSLGSKPLSDAQAATLHTELNGTWDRRKNIELWKSFSFRNFRDAFAFATQIALLAEGEAHRPELCVSWGEVRVRLTTNAACGLTENDFILAAKIDRLPSGVVS